LKVNVSLSQFSWKAVPQRGTGSYKTPVSIVRYDTIEEINVDSKAEYTA